MVGQTQTTGTISGRWSSKKAFILAAVGSAVGLGNLWRFPYEAGTNGGGAFVAFYIFCVILIGLPLLLSEMMIGRIGRSSAVASAEKLAIESGRSPHWSLLASVGMWGAFIILITYSVVAGWVLYYIGLFAGDVLTNGIVPAFRGVESSEVSAYMSKLRANPVMTISLHGVFMLMTIAIVARGVTSGIEKVATWLMPTFFLLFLFITLFSVFTGDGEKAVTFLFTFSPERLWEDPNIMLKALGQAFFSLSLGSALMITYGAYAGRDTNLSETAGIIGIADTAVAIIAGLAIFPLVFAANLDIAAGPTLMFQSLPLAFTEMPGGSLIGLLFFIMVLFAALTSSVALLEAPVARVLELGKRSRMVTAIVVGGLIFIIGTFAALSEARNIPNPFAIIGLYEDMTLFGALGSLPDLILPISGLLTALFIGWFADRRLVDDNSGLSGPMLFVWRFLVAWVCPITVGAVLVAGLR